MPNPDWNKSRSSIKCCHGCVAPKRYPGCHAKCEQYQKEKARYKEQMREYKKSEPVRLTLYDFDKVGMKIGSKW